MDFKKVAKKTPDPQICSFKLLWNPNSQSKEFIFGRLKTARGRNFRSRYIMDFEKSAKKKKGEPLDVLRFTCEEM